MSTGQNQSFPGMDPGNTESHFQDLGLSPRIGPTGFSVGIFTVLTISILTIIARIILRLQRTKALAIDDYFLIFALCCLITAVSVLQAYRDGIYLTINVELGNAVPPQGYMDIAGSQIKVLDASSVLLWASIFCVKWSFLFFFHKLISRVRALQIYWWVAFVFVTMAGFVCIPLGFIECAYFGPDPLEHCTPTSLIANEHIYLDVTIVLDILTDAVLIGLPIALLWSVKIELAKKLTLLGIFGLSIVMIIIALIRVAMAPLSPQITDTPWLFFWQIMEASIALMMVSVSAFRGLFGQAGKATYSYNHNHQHKSNTADPNKKAGFSGKPSQNGNMSSEGSDLEARRQALKERISAPTAPTTLHSMTPGAAAEFAKYGRAAAFEMDEVSPPSTRAASRSPSRSREGRPTTGLRHASPAARVAGRHEGSRREHSPSAVAKEQTNAASGMGFQRSESPVTTRVWAGDEPHDHDEEDGGSGRRTPLQRGASLRNAMHRAKRSIGGAKEPADSRSRTPSLGEALIEREESRVHPQQWV